MTPDWLLKKIQAFQGLSSHKLSFQLYSPRESIHYLLPVPTVPGCQHDSLLQFLRYHLFRQAFPDCPGWSNTRTHTSLHLRAMPTPDSSTLLFSIALHRYLFYFLCLPTRNSMNIKILSCAFLYMHSKFLEQYLAYRRCSINVIWMFTQNFLLMFSQCKMPCPPTKILLTLQTWLKYTSVNLLIVPSKTHCAINCYMIIIWFSSHFSLQYHGIFINLFFASTSRL